MQEGVLFVDEMASKLSEQKELAELVAAEEDAALSREIKDKLQEIENGLARREHEMQFSGPHDRDHALFTIQAGAGGTDAQDWAEMLERMYLRFAEARGWQTKMIDRSPGEEAGIKQSSFEVAGNYAYGVLKSEHGVHRLVRQSPFNADKLRQTSFARVEVIPKIEAKEAPEIDTKDLEVGTFRASGAGGQHVNKTSSAVRIRHLPTGIVVQCQNERSQAQNKAQAMAVLQSKLQILAEQQHANNIKELRGETKQAAWGNQIRSYVMHPYSLVKDHRTEAQETNVQKVLNGDLSAFISGP